MPIERWGESRPTQRAASAGNSADAHASRGRRGISHVGRLPRLRHLAELSATPREAARPPMQDCADRSLQAARALAALPDRATSGCEFVRGLTMMPPCGRSPGLLPKRKSDPLNFGNALPPRPAPARLLRRRVPPLHHAAPIGRLRLTSTPPASVLGSAAD